jgi:hypothetical protein
MQGVLHQRQGAGLVLGLCHHGLLYLAHVQPGQPGRAADDLPQAAGTDGRQSPGPCALVAYLGKSRQVFSEAVEEVRAHGGDEKQGAVGIRERSREQPVEALALVRVGEGEQLLLAAEEEAGLVDLECFISLSLWERVGYKIAALTRAP